MTAPRLLLAAGGTGGHIFPAIAFGRWAEEHAGAEVSYVCGSRALEIDIYRASGIEPRILSVSGSPLGARGIKILTRSGELLRSFREAARYVREFDPNFCVTFGGYSSAPILWAARREGVPCLTHEQNARAGRMTRLAAMLDIPVAAGWDVCEPLAPDDFEHVGVPVRRFRPMTKADALDELELPARLVKCPVVFIMTGSLGSRDVRELFLHISERAALKEWAFVAVAGTGSAEANGERFFTVPGRWDPSPFFAAADCAVTRGGASTLAEVMSLGLPSVSIPWRGAAGDHQMRNALCVASDPRHKIWDELSSDADGLEKKMSELSNFFAVATDNHVKKLYNQTGSASEKLWDYVARLSRKREE